MLTSGNAGWIGGAIPISEIIHHSVRRTSSRAFTSRREPSSKRVMAHFFHVFFLPLSSLSSTLNLVSRASVSRCRFEMRFARCFFAIQKVNAANTLPGLLDSALCSKRLRIMDRTDGRSRRIPPLFSIRTLLSCHPPVFSNGS